MVQDEFQTQEVSQPLGKKRQNRCGDDIYSSQQANTNGQLSEEPVKSLGRWYNSSMKDTKRRQETAELASEGPLANNRRGLQGKLKEWCLQFMLIHKLLWPLLIYKLCSTTVEAIEAKINKFTMRWLGVPPGLTDVQCTAAKQN